MDRLIAAKPLQSGALPTELLPETCNHLTKLVLKHFRSTFEKLIFITDLGFADFLV